MENYMIAKLKNKFHFFTHTHTQKRAYTHKEKTSEIFTHKFVFPVGSEQFSNFRQAYPFIIWRGTELESFYLYCETSVGWGSGKTRLVVVVVVVIYEQQWEELHEKEGSNLEALNNFGFLGFINSK